MKYRFQTLYELDSLAVVNVRDVGNCKNAFKILMFPDTRMFQAENPKAKVGPHDIIHWTQNTNQWLPINQHPAKELLTHPALVIMFR